MKLLNRTQIFSQQNNISSLIKGFQTIFFDPEYNKVEDEMFDAMFLQRNKVEASSFSLMVKHSDLNSYPIKLAKVLTGLLKHLRTEELILISHLKLDLFGNLEHDYEKVRSAYSALSEITNSTTYKEALMIEVAELENLVEIFFWLERCDASIPEYIFWTDSQDRFCFYFCKYGNIHFINFSNDNLITQTQLQSLGFTVDEDYDQFTITGKIENRQIKF